jgi:NAD(P)-dependent dehydrogenase (short-subunit alcohol dehydrogenase family)/cation diffusion facilitator CzcD-associated flavoprotein CzcO
MTRGRYCLIGAGAAGVGTLRVLRDEGFSVDCFERSDRVGGHWHSDYECLHLITPRDSSGFDGHPMPSDYPLFPSRDQMRDYIMGFSAQHGLGSHIRLGTAVTSARPLDANGLAGWEVATSDGERRRYDGVIVANGHLWDPFVPDYPGRFAGHVLHSGRYRNAGDLRGDRVLVVGAGNSGCDLAVDAAQAGRETHVSVRNGLVFQPKTLFGRPRSELPLLARLPVRVQERLTRALIDVALGRPERYGLPEPSTRNLHRNRPVVNGQLLHFIHHGRVRVAPGIDRFDGHDVHFTNGTTRAFDTIVFATGFKVTLPFLDSASLQWAGGVPLRVAGMTLPVGLEQLYFVGLAAPRGPQLPVYSAQARLIAKFLMAQARAGTELSGLYARSSRPEARIDIPRHEWQRAPAHRPHPPSHARPCRRTPARDHRSAALPGDPRMTARLAGRTALITGGARGQGAAHARRLAEEGASIIIGDILDDAGAAHAEALRAAGHTADFLHLDVTAPGDWSAAVRAAEERFGRLDILVNNAGVVRVAPVVDETDDGWHNTMTVNATGVFYGMRAAIPALRRAGGGSIINVASIYGPVGASGYVAYTASKGAVIAMTKVAALEHAHNRIRVNAICPGPVRSPMSEQEGDASVDVTPLRRLAEPDEISSAVAFLASDDAVYMTGAELAIDGGYLAR